MAKAYGVVYYIVNTINGKMYVGQTIYSLKKRFYEHEHCKKYPIGKAIRKYGKENFRCGIIKSCMSKAEMDKWEKFFIIALNTKSNGYNQTDGGEGVVGFKASPETCAKMSANRTGDKNGFFGKHHTKKSCVTLSTIKRSKTPYQNLLAEMDKLQLTYTELAKILGLSGTFSRKILGKRKFTESQISKLVEIFQKPAEYLMKRNDGIPSILSKWRRTSYKNLLKEMCNKGLYYTTLAQILGLSQRNLSAKMRDKAKFTTNEIAKLAEIFDKPKEYLFARDDGKNFVSKYSKSPYKNLIAEIDNKKLTYTSIAKVLGLSLSAISSKMNGKVNFTERDKAKLAEFFGKPIEYLMFKEEF